MAIRKIPNKQKVTINLDSEVYSKIRDMFPVAGASQGIRAILRNFVNQSETERARIAESVVAEIDV